MSSNTSTQPFDPTRIEDVSAPFRFCFKVRVQYVPSKPGARPILIADTFMMKYFQRTFDWNRDWLHCHPALVDKTRGSAYMLLDINFSSGSAPMFYSLLAQFKDGECNFVKNIKNNEREIKNFTDVVYPWDGEKKRAKPRPIVTL